MMSFLYSATNYIVQACVTASVVSLVRVPGYRSRGVGSIPGATRFSEKLWVWDGVHSAL
jgi:hypothetical protein